MCSLPFRHFYFGIPLSDIAVIVLSLATSRPNPPKLPRRFGKHLNYKTPSPRQRTRRLLETRSITKYFGQFLNGTSPEHRSTVFIPSSTAPIS